MLSYGKECAQQIRENVGFLASLGIATWSGQGRSAQKCVTVNKRENDDYPNKPFLSKKDKVPESRTAKETRNNNFSIRVFCGRVYYPVMEVTCHQCRQKAVNKIHCSNKAAP
ncbi:hypothetical protein BX070DRAFT_89712 [Coemansia spiralis]|nr:hypothetical protein BX070DRAFT_89712 [Coemansia spiralis]